MTGPAVCGTRLAGIGAAVPPRVLTNKDLESMMDTTDEWIVKRTGIRRRHIVDQETDGEFELATRAIQGALADAKLEGSDLDLLIHASVTSEMTCPSNACRIANVIGATPAPAFDLVAACSGFVYGLCVADSLVRSGRHRTVGVIGCDALSTISDFSERTVSILFGDGAGAAVVTRDDDPGRGCIYQKMAADGSMWDSLYMPRRPREIPEWDKDNVIKLGCLRMSGRDVFRFAVTTFREVIEEALKATGLAVDDVAQFVCHQSNIRIIEAAMDRLGLPPEKVHINIDEYGNTSAGSVGLVLDELQKAGKLRAGEHVVIVAFGGGMTWATSVWKL